MASSAAASPSSCAVVAGVSASAAPLCPVQTSMPCSLEFNLSSSSTPTNSPLPPSTPQQTLTKMNSGAEEPEYECYKLGKRKRSYNQVELTFSSANGTHSVAVADAKLVPGPELAPSDESDGTLLYDVIELVEDVWAALKEHATLNLRLAEWVARHEAACHKASGVMLGKSMLTNSWNVQGSTGGHEDTNNTPLCVTLILYPYGGRLATLRGYVDVPPMHVVVTEPGLLYRELHWGAYDVNSICNLSDEKLVAKDADRYAVSFYVSSRVHSKLVDNKESMKEAEEELVTHLQREIKMEKISNYFAKRLE